MFFSARCPPHLDEIPGSQLAVVLNKKWRHALIIAFIFGRDKLASIQKLQSALVCDLKLNILVEKQSVNLGIPGWVFNCAIHGDDFEGIRVQRQQLRVLNYHVFALVRESAPNEKGKLCKIIKTPIG